MQLSTHIRACSSCIVAVLHPLLCSCCNVTIYTKIVAIALADRAPSPLLQRRGVTNPPQQGTGDAAPAHPPHLHPQSGAASPLHHCLQPGAHTDSRCAPHPAPGRGGEEPPPPGPDTGEPTALGLGAGATGALPLQPDIKGGAVPIKVCFRPELGVLPEVLLVVTDRGRQLRLEAARHLPVPVGALPQSRGRFPLATHTHHATTRGRKTHPTEQ